MDKPRTSSMNDEHSCIICEKLGSSSKTNADLGDIIKISRGVTTLRAASSERQDGLLPHLQTEFVYAHSICRQKYIEMAQNKPNETSFSPPKKKLRCSTVLSSFDWGKNCFLCGQEADEEKQAKFNKNRRRQISYINTPTLNDTFVNFIAVQKDDYYREIHKRISGIVDLQTLQAKYHADCYNLLRNSIQMDKTEKKVSPRILMIDAAMEQIYKYIEDNDDCQFTMQELKNIITTDKFLSNNKNKGHLIEMLRIKLADNNIFTCQAESDADKLIVDTAINLKTKNVVIVSEDIDVLVILTALVDEDREIYFLKPSRGKVQQKIFSSKSLENSFPKCKEHILFLHAFTGCDTTSTFFNKGKIKFAKNFEKCHDLHESAKVFKNVNEDANNIFEAGITCILGLYGAPAKIKDLNTLRFNSFIKATAKKTSVVLSSLPPTTDAAFEHLKRVYLQIQIWLGNDVNIENWGWKYSQNMFIPVTMTQLPAPDNLLQMLFCNCKKGCGAACGCRKSGLYCSVACLQCNDNNCLNTQPIIQINEVEENI